MAKKPPMKRWTVVGFYPDNRERSTRWVRAISAEKAEEKVTRGMEWRGESYVLCGVFAGHIYSEDSGSDEPTTVNWEGRF